MNGVPQRRRKWICLLIIQLVLVLGIYCENDRADSASVCAPASTTGSYLTSADTMLHEEQACTAELLGMQGNIGPEQGILRYTDSNKDTGFHPDSLYLVNDFQYIGTSEAGSETVLPVSGHPDTLVTNYIHRSDGKKRI